MTNEQLASMSPWEIAEQWGIGFSGDMNPIQHGGFFYDYRDWEANGYAPCVEFWEEPETHFLIVQPGVINKPDSKDMDAAFRFIGLDDSDAIWNRSNIHAQIEASRSYSGIEFEGNDYPYLKSFNLDTWKERNIWKSVRGWIEKLGK